MTILDQILGAKHAEVNSRKKRAPLSDLQSSPFFSRETFSLRAALLDAGFGIIAEVKKASPSRGVLRADFRPADIARSYAENGATAISVLTDERFFHGSLDDLASVRQVVGIPLLRKDFVIDEYQLFEARAAGADAVLLIVAALTPHRLTELIRVAHELQLDVLVEIHTRKDLDSVGDLPDCVIGVNNRDLHTFDTTLDTSFSLRSFLPREALCISESGIGTADDLRLLNSAGFQGALIGERLMRESDPGAGLKTLLDGFNHSGGEL